ncbi:DUF2884 family protein [Dyella sp. LX-66]|uniref:DUF2884 family protein n=1 Tax=unclassified Dyella TaxID=2634549 RepID=UPI001BE0C0DB|nr:MULTISPECIES: DUF2884 family protein [unclassified Dyella]MBT2116639.1 DUF2884 family protein [Dyella sp. LX-1]MBT2139181.1 DUF2884 family protein [Dyella sp. LX-66]
MLKQGLIPLLALCALATGCDSGSSINTSHGDIRVHGGLLVLAADGAPRATIDAAGVLNIDGKTISVDDRQRDLLRRYYTSATAVRQHGIETGKAGAAMAGEALKGVAETVAGDKDSVDKRVEAQTQKITDQVMKICDDLADIKVVQDELATSLPAFKPYAGIMDEKSVTDCRNDEKTERKD